MPKNDITLISVCLLQSKCILLLYLNHFNTEEIISGASEVGKMPLIRSIISNTTNLINSRFTERSQENLTKLIEEMNKVSNQQL